MGKDINEQMLEASTKGYVNEVMKLLKNGADVDTRNQENFTPLICASRYGRTETAELLIDKGADIEAETIYEDTPLAWACFNGHTEIAESLIAAGADIAFKNTVGSSLLIIACHNGHTETVKLLLEHSVDISTFNLNDETCFDNHYQGMWKAEHSQELIINKQPHNIKFFDDKIGIIPSLKLKYKDIIELSLMGLF